jgi:predicted O-linked N-acetylglucosamine transferase (SPINDLY family)
MENFPKNRKSDILATYLHSVAESNLCTYITANIDNSLDVIHKHLQARADNTDSWRDYICLGNFLVFAGRFDEAEHAYRQAVEINDSSIGYSNLSFVLRLLGRLRESHVAMGLSNFSQRSFDLAIEDYVCALSLGERSARIYEQLAQSYLHERQFFQAAAVCTEATVKNATTRLYTLWIEALTALNEIGRALEVAERAHAAFPDHHHFRFQSRLILPIIYKSYKDILIHRGRFQRTLHEWSVKCCTDQSYVSNNAINDIKTTNFYLPYQGKSDVDIHREYGNLLHRIMTATYPKFVDLPARQPHRHRIRVGYISAFCNWHTVGKLFLGWVEHHNPNKFDTYVYHLGREMDFLSFRFEAASTKFAHISDCSLVEACDCIRADNLDILVYLEFGMSVMITKIAALRLAPIQCLAWGHPVSSGLPTMDYFISSAMMEPPDSDRHYSEALVKLPNIGVCVPQPYRSIPHKSRSDFGLSDDRTIYLFPHSLFKWLPQYDRVFPSIAKQDKSAQFVFIERETHSVEAAQVFKTRVAAAFRQRNLEPDKYLLFVPSMSTQNFLELLSLADVYLDSIGWSGGMTTLEAIGCMLPVVTLPGKFMRGRHAYGCLKRIGVMETAAQDIDTYVHIAARLGLDREWRKFITLKQASQLHKLYDDTECILALETFYRSVANRD